LKFKDRDSAQRITTTGTSSFGFCHCGFNLPVASADTVFKLTYGGVCESSFKFAVTGPCETARGALRLSTGCCLSGYVACGPGCCRLRAAENAGQHRRGSARSPEVAQFRAARLFGRAVSTFHKTANRARGLWIPLAPRSECRGRLRVGIMMVPP
jgi:hypothetical protein